MSRDYRVFLDDILEAVGKIEEYTRGMSKEEFSRDSRTRDAVVRNLEIIGEAVKQLPEEVRARQADVEWKKIGGLRDILIHRYFGIDAEIIWDILANKLPLLKQQVSRLSSQ